MDSSLKTFMDSFLQSFAKESGRLTAGALFNYISSRISKVNQATTKTQHLGRIYYMNDNTLLLYSQQEGAVYGKSIAHYGNRWVSTDITIYEDPSSFNGGYAYSQNISIDNNGRYYYD